MESRSVESLGNVRVADVGIGCFYQQSNGAGLSSIRHLDVTVKYPQDERICLGRYLDGITSPTISLIQPSAEPSWTRYDEHSGSDDGEGSVIRDGEG